MSLVVSHTHLIYLIAGQSQTLSLLCVDVQTVDHHAQSLLLELCKKMSERDLNKEVSDQHILEIYPQLENWKRVAAHLGLTRADVQAIDSGARPDEKLMRLNMLQEWKSKKMLDGTDTYGALLNALIQCGCTESANQVCQLLA